MKKFLSLLLALVMTMSLVTISAGATEYKDLTDKDELGPQYQEAVAVLNKIGVITGYDDGSFRPDVELTRGAAAKIIVSLLIGPEAANNLPNNRAPYPDVPANHTFAGVIAYCQTAGIINGYGDGTFKPANDLTGYAFAKMLLSALGYDNTIEKFVDTGWTMNVLNVGQAAGLFDRLDFKGSEAVTRKDAALLALNTLKATVVEYKNGQNITVTGENTNVTVSTEAQADYKISNQDFAKNILTQRRDANRTQGTDWWTVEFAEEHFIDLRLTSDKYSPIDNDFGRPSAEWSYKKLSIGKFPLVPDFEYTTQVIHDVNTVTDGAKVRALGLNGYSVEKTVNGTTSRTALWINGAGPYYFNSNKTSSVTVGDKTVVLDSVAAIANFTDNGTLVEVYVDNNGADFITDVVVVRTQLMEVRRVGSDYVSLDVYDDHSDADGKVLYGYNFVPIDEKVNNVEAEDDYYEFLSGLKAGDKVAVVPVAVGHDPKAYDVAEAYTPETVTGALTAVDNYGAVGTDRNAVTLTVGGTKYNIALWNKDMREINSDSIKVTRKDVTLTLDKYGNALQASDVGATSDWMVIGNYRQGLVNGVIVTYANGWDIAGNEVSLNIGYQHDTTGANRAEQQFPVGSLVHYTNDTKSNTAEWRLEKTGIFAVSDKAKDGVENYTITSSSSRLYLDTELNDTADNTTPWDDVPTGYEMPFYTNNVPFIYITLDDDGEVDSIEIKKNPQSVTNAEILGDSKSFGGSVWSRAEAAVTLKDGDLKKPASDAGIEAVVFKKESSAVSLNNLLYITKYEGSEQKDSKGNMVQGYHVAMLGEGGKLVDSDKLIYSSRTGLKVGTFARYTLSAHDEFEDFYTLRPFGSPAKDTAGKSVAVLSAKLGHNGKGTFVGANSRMVYLDPADLSTINYSVKSFQKDADTSLADELYTGTQDSVNNLVNIRRAQWVDLTGYQQDIESPSELKDAYLDVIEAHKDEYHRDITVTLLFNDNPESDEFRQVYMVVVNSIASQSNDHKNNASGTTTPDVPEGTKYTLTLSGTWATPNAIAGTTLWAADGVTPITLENATTINGAAWSAKVDAGTTVQLKSTSLNADKTVLVNGERLTVENGIVKIVMDKDKTLDSASFANTSEARTFAITFEDGITPTKFVGLSHDPGNAPYDIDASTVEHSGNTYYVTDFMNVTDVYVTTSQAEYAFACQTEIDATGPDTTVTQAPANKGTAQRVSFQATVSGPWTIYNATKVNVVKVNPAFFGWTKAGYNDTTDTAVFYVRPSATITSENFAADDNRAGVLVSTGSTPAVASSEKLSTTGRTVGNTELTLVGALEVTLENVEATVDGTKYTDTFYVAYGTSLAAAAFTPTAGTKVLQDVVAGAAFSSGTVTANTSFYGASQYNTTGVDATYALGTTIQTVADQAYVKVGQELTFEASATGTGNIKVEDTASPTPNDLSAGLRNKVAGTGNSTTGTKAAALWTMGSTDIEVSVAP